MAWLSKNMKNNIHAHENNMNVGTVLQSKGLFTYHTTFDIISIVAI